jgi:hypothetical protein
LSRHPATTLHICSTVQRHVPASALAAATSIAQSLHLFFQRNNYESSSTSQQGCAFHTSDMLNWTQHMADDMIWL